MPWDLDNNRPIYLQLMEKIQQDIISGVYHAGDRLPSVRELALEASVNPNTMQKALSELERNGLVHTQRTSGRFITEDKTIEDRTCCRTHSRFSKHYETAWFPSGRNTGANRKNDKRGCII